MVNAAINRKRWEARLLSSELIGLLSTAMGGSKSGGTKVSADQMMRDNGVGFQ